MLGSFGLVLVADRLSLTGSRVKSNEEKKRKISYQHALYYSGPLSNSAVINLLIVIALL